MKKTILKVCALLAGAMLLGSCSGVGGNSNSNPGGGGGSSSSSKLATTVWLFEDEGPVKPDTGGGDSGGTSGGDTGGSSGGDNEGTETKPAPNRTEKEPKQYVYFLDNEYAFYGEITVVDTYENDKLTSTSVEKYSPRYAGTYKTQGGKIEFSFTHDYEPNLKVWTNAPIQGKNKVINTIDQDKEPDDYGLIKSIDYKVGNKLRFGSDKKWYDWVKDSYDLDKAQLKANATKEKLTSTDMSHCIFISEKNAQSNLYDFICFENSKLVSTGKLIKNEGEIFNKTKDTYSFDTVEAKDTFYGQYDSKILKVTKSSADLYARPNASEWYKVEKSENTIKLTDSSTNKVYTQLPKNTKIYAESSEKEAFLKNAEADSGMGEGGNPYSIRAAAYDDQYGNPEDYPGYPGPNGNGGVDGNSDPAYPGQGGNPGPGGNPEVNSDAKNLAGYIKDYPKLKPEYKADDWSTTPPTPGQFPDDTYNKDKDWCYQGATYKGYKDNKLNLLLTFDVNGDAKENSTIGTYTLKDLLDGKDYTIDAVLPGRFRATNNGTKSWVSVEKNNVADGKGSNVVDITINKNKYTLCYKELPFIDEKFTETENVKLTSLYVMPAQNDNLTDVIEATIDDKNNTVTLKLPASVDKTNVVFNYSLNHKEAKLNAKFTKNPGYKPAYEDAPIQEWIKLDNIFIPVRPFVGYYEHTGLDDTTRKGPYWMINDAANPNDLKTPYKFPEDSNNISMIQALSAPKVTDGYNKRSCPQEVSKENSGYGLTESMLLDETLVIKAPDGRAQFKSKSDSETSYYICSPKDIEPGEGQDQNTRKESYLTYDAFVYFRNVYKDLKDCKTQGTKFNLNKHLKDYPASIEWKKPQATVANRSISNGQAGYIPSNDKSKAQGYDLTNISMFQVYCYISATSDKPEQKYTKEYTLIIE